MYILGLEGHYVYMAGCPLNLKLVPDHETKKDLN